MALQPVTVGGIEFDALIKENLQRSATIPQYAVEDGFDVSDTIHLEPVSLTMTLYVTATPVTFQAKHGHQRNRVQAICDQLEIKYLQRELVTIKTPVRTYNNMGITSFSYERSATTRYAREISLSAREVFVTKQSAGWIDTESHKSGISQVLGGMASFTSCNDLEKLAILMLLDAMW